MPVGAIIGGAVIGAGGAVASGAMSSHAQSKAAQTAADTASSTADKNNALYASIYGQNKDLLTPTVNQGQQAGNALNALLLGSPSTGSTGSAASPGTPAATPDFRAGLPARTDWASGALSAIGAPATSDPIGALQGTITHLNPRQQSAWAGYLSGNPDPDTVYEQRQAAYHPPAAGAPSTVSTSGALNAFDQFKQGTNYQWRFNQGMNALSGQWAARGALDSGAAQKAAITFGQNTASGELSNYMNLLAQQQGFGLSAASAVAGVGNTYASNVAGQNTNASNVTANAALTSGQASANMWGTVGNATGQLGGALFQYGMGQMQQPKIPTAQSVNVTPNGTSGYFAAHPF